MSYSLFHPQKIYIEEAARHFPLTEAILKRLPQTPCEVITDIRALNESLRQKRDPIGEGKRALLLAYDRGCSFKPFPEAEQYLSCDYFTLHTAEGCDLECSYCILQAYLTNPLLTVYVNIEEMLANLQKVLADNPNKFFRIGTGQLSDSLSLDHITGFSEILIPFFSQQKNALLELKTKSINIERLLTLNPQGHAMVGWSLNSKKVTREEEHKCASIPERLAAAKQITALPGWRANFHFDPIIDYPGWEKDYEEVIADLFHAIAPERIGWISLGCLRMMPELKPIMEDRFPKSKLPAAEWIKGMDGKLRYFKPSRIEIYKTIVRMIRERAPHVTLYLSMESPEVWEQVFGQAVTRETVCQLLDSAAKKSKQ
jgi:spore photoproduct lyase